MGPSRECSLIQQPVLEFDQFMALPPCTTGTHASAPPPSTSSTSTSSSSSAPVATYINEDGKEVYGVAPKPPTQTDTSTPMAPTPVAPAPANRKGEGSTKAEVEVEQDDLNEVVKDDAPCKRLGCKARWQGEGVSRGDGEGAKCRYHPQPVSLTLYASDARLDMHSEVLATVNQGKANLLILMTLSISGACDTGSGAY